MRRALFFSLLLLVNTLIYAQQRTITGTVYSSDDGSTLYGVSVYVSGTTIGTITDDNGQYSLDIPQESDSLAFSFLGMIPQVIKIGTSSTYDVTMESDILSFDEVVVTALGIEKKSKGLTYATQKIDGKDLTTVKSTNMINSLSGKTAGLVIGKSSSGVGGSSRVIIRGNKSISGENQPLYVIDGIPMNSSTMGQIGGNRFSGTVDGGDAISNLNPEDIESINVLKGASASALYGSMGQNGVILITTKKGSAGKTSVELTSSTTIDRAMVVPELQSEYGLTTPIDPTSTMNEPFTWGAKDNSSISSDDIKDFFRTGVTTINGISVSSGNDISKFYVSYANTSASGIVENNKLSKHNFMVNGSSKIGNKITVNGSANIINQKVKNRPFGGFENNPVGEAYLYGAPATDFNSLKDNYKTYDATRGIYVQNGPFSGYNSTSFMLDNPYWTIYNNPNTLKRNRSIISGGLSYDITDHFNLRARGSFDRVTDEFEQDIYASSTSIKYDDKGAYHTINQSSNQVYGDAFLSYNNDELGDFSLDAILGTSHSYSTGYTAEIETTGEDNFITANVFSLSNLKGAFTHTESTTEILNQSIFGTATVGYKDMFFVDFTGRQEWASTISDESFFYPSVGATAILTQWLGSNNILSFAKIRGSYSEVGNDLPYGANNPAEQQYWSVVNETPSSPNTGIQILDDGTPVELKPERSKSMEFGLNMRFFDNSVTLDLSYYKNNVINQYLKVAAPVGAYISNYYVNAGEIQNNGIEATLGYKYAKSKNFTYNTNFNFAYNKNEIISINERSNLTEYIPTTFGMTKTAEIRMVKGRQFGDMYAPDFNRNADGSILLSDNAPSATNSDEYVKVGNPNSPVNMGWSNTFIYKDFTFSFLIDAKIGGNVISFTESELDEYGRSQRTADARDAGQVVFEGNVVATGNDEIEAWFKGLSTIKSNYVYDATAVRLREASITYNIPVDFSNGKIKQLSVSLVGSNLLFLYKDAPFDPEVSAGSITGLQGIEALSLPSTRSFGFSLKANF